MAQIEWFCTPAEEKKIFEQLLTSGDVVPLNSVAARPDDPPIFDLSSVPPWLTNVQFLFWLRSAGKLRWIQNQPRWRSGGTSAQFKNSVRTVETWKQVKPRKGTALLDLEKSPVIVYGRFDDDCGIAPCSLVTPMSSMKRISPAFERWVNQLIAGVRKGSTKIHDSKKRTKLIDTDGYPNTLYAFPEALKLLRKGKPCWKW